MLIESFDRDAVLKYGWPGDPFPYPLIYDFGANADELAVYFSRQNRGFDPENNPDLSGIEFSVFTYYILKYCPVETLKAFLYKSEPQYAPFSYYGKYTESNQGNLGTYSSKDGVEVNHMLIILLINRVRKPETDWFSVKDEFMNLCRDVPAKELYVTSFLSCMQRLELMISYGDRETLNRGAIGFYSAGWQK